FVFHQLDQDAGRAGRVEECDPAAVSAAARLVVHEADACAPEALQRGGDVLHGVGQVVEPRAAALEEPGHGRVGRDRLDQLEPRGSRADEGHLYPLVFDSLDRGTAAARDEFEQWERLGDRMYGDADVIEWELRHRNVPGTRWQAPAG